MGSGVFPDIHWGKTLKWIQWCNTSLLIQKGAKVPF